MTQETRRKHGRIRTFFHDLFHRNRDADRARSHSSFTRPASLDPTSLAVRPLVDAPASDRGNQDLGGCSEDPAGIETRHTDDMQLVRGPPPVPTFSGGYDPSLTTGNSSPPGEMPLVHLDDSVGDGSESGSSVGWAKPFVRTAWSAFRDALRVTEAVSDAFPPLKGAMSGLNHMLDRIELIGDNQENFADIIYRVNSFTEVIQRYRDLIDANIPMEIHKRVNGFARTLDLQKAVIEDKFNRGIIKRVIEASDDQTEIVRHIRTIGHLVDQFMLATTLNTDANVVELLKDAKFNKLKYFAEAAFNGPHSFGKGCMEDTRVSVLGDLMSWAVDSGPTASNVYWLTGLAGTGKSAIAYTFCRLLSDAGLLGGSFFCSGQGFLEQCDVHYIFPTLAQLLARVSGLYAAALLKSLERVPDCAKLALDEQFENLMQRPFAAIYAKNFKTYILVIDALDECEDHDKVLALVHLFAQYARSLNIKIFMTSRPENQMKKRFSHLHMSHILYLHHIEESFVKSDIYKYLEKKLFEMFRSHYGSDDYLPLPAQIETLTRLSDKLFIYAFTAVQYIGWKNADPEERLATLTNEDQLELGDVITGSLHGLYHFILSDAFQSLNEVEKAYRQNFLACILSQFRPMSIQTISKFLNVKLHQMSAITSGFHSVLDIPANNSKAYIIKFHASFGDYVTSKQLENKCDWYLEISYAHYYMAHRCFKIMKEHLHFNIVKCKTSYLLNDMQDFALLPEELIYACIYWPEHLLRCSNEQTLICYLTYWMKNLFLYWLEVISISKMVNQCTIMLRKISQKYIKRSIITPSVQIALNDIVHFLNTYQEPISASVPHIYISALPFGMRDLQSFKIYAKQCPNLLTLYGNFKNNANCPNISLVGHTDSVTLVKFSSDGKYIVSGSCDNTIRYWIPDTGEAIGQPITIHCCAMTSFAISPDDNYLTSDFCSCVGLWRLDTGELIRKTTDKNNGMIYTTAISSDGQYIVSGSFDKKIRLWRSDTGEAIGKPMEGHNATISSLAFSPNGKYIVSGSLDGTIRLWTTDTCESVGDPLLGHHGAVSSIAFSSNRQCIVSGSYNGTIKLWELDTRKAIGKPMKEHERGVTSVTFSPDGQYIAFGSGNGTIRLWNTDTCENIGHTLLGHESRINSISFSPNGQYIVSGSTDATIKVWKLTMIQTTKKARRISSKKSVSSLSFLSDGQCIIANSHHNPIKIWKSDMDEAIKEPVKNYEILVKSVIFSSDDQYLVSSSEDEVTRLWKSDIYVAIGAPINGDKVQAVSVTFPLNGQCVVSNYKDNTIRFWMSNVDNAIKEFMTKYKHNMSAIATSSDGQYIAFSSYEGLLNLQRLDVAKPVKIQMAEHKGVVASVAFSPDGQYIVSGYWDGTIRLWLVDTCKCIGEPMIGHDSAVLSIAFSPNDGQYIVSGSRDSTIRVWRSNTRKPIGKPIYGHNHDVILVLFSADGRYIISASLDNTIKMWRLDFDDATQDPGDRQSVFLLCCNHNTSSFADKSISIQSMNSGINNSQSSCNKVSTMMIEDCISKFSERLISPYSYKARKHRQKFKEKKLWLLGPNQELLLWIPSHYIQHIHWPHPHEHFDSTSYLFTINLGSFQHGDTWTRYRGSIQDEDEVL